MGISLSIGSWIIMIWSGAVFHVFQVGKRHSWVVAEQSFSWHQLPYNLVLFLVQASGSTAAFLLGASALLLALGRRSARVSRNVWTFYPLKKDPFLVYVGGNARFICFSLQICLSAAGRRHVPGGVLAGLGWELHGWQLAITSELAKTEQVDLGSEDPVTWRNGGGRGDARWMVMVGDGGWMVLSHPVAVWMRYMKQQKILRETWRMVGKLWKVQGLES